MNELRALIRKTLLETFLTQEGFTANVFGKTSPENKVDAEKWAKQMNNIGVNSGINLDSDTFEFRILSYTFEILAYAFKEGDGATYTMPTTGEQIIVNRNNIIKAIEVALDPTHMNFAKYLSSAKLVITPQIADRIDFIDLARSQITGKIKHAQKIKKFTSISGIDDENIQELPSIVESAIYEYTSGDMESVKNSLFMFILNALRGRISQMIFRKKLASGNADFDKVASETNQESEEMKRIKDILQISALEIYELIKQKSLNYASIFKTYLEISFANDEKLSSHDKNNLLYQKFVNNDLSEDAENFIQKRILKKFNTLEVNEESVKYILKELKKECFRLYKTIPNFSTKMLEILKTNGLDSVDEAIKHFGIEDTVKLFMNAMVGNPEEEIKKSLKKIGTSLSTPDKPIEINNDSADAEDDDEYEQMPYEAIQAAFGNNMNPRDYYNQIYKPRREKELEKLKNKNTTKQYQELDEVQNLNNTKTTDSLYDLMSLLTSFEDNNRTDLQEARKLIKLILLNKI